jgi:hypothetical protein
LGDAPALGDWTLEKEGFALAEDLRVRDEELLFRLHSGPRCDLCGQIAAALPDTKPAFTDFVVADNGRLWAQRPARGPDAKRVPWWILDPKTKTIRTVRLPREVDLHAVKKGHAHGSTTTEAGAPAVVRYRVD